MPVPVSEKVKICIDRGGTFTDVIALSESKGDHVVKLLSVDPDNYADAPTEGVRRVLEWFTDTKVPRGVPIDTSRIDYLRMGTTVATNALLERKGERCALLITKGHADALEIAFQTRPHLFQLAVKKPDVLYSKVVEIDERVIPVWHEFLEGTDHAAHTGLGGRLVKTASGVTVREVEPVEVDKAVRDLAALHEEGYRSIAVVLAHSYLFPEHEQLVAKIAREIGFDNVSVSSDIEAKIGFIARGQSTTADAYLTPEVQRYLNGFAKGFKGKLEDSDCRVSFMQSDGALADFRRFSGLRAILSGPAGGVVGFARTSFDALEGSPVVGFDMGGTSTDVSRFNGEFEHVFETTTAGVTIQVPQLDINTVAAGGGSILTYGNQMFKVGPESAGAHPGPACYRKGGPLTVTDANLFLGRLHIDSFPKIFGPTEDMPLDVDVVRAKFEALTREINEANGSTLTPAQVACGFINVADSSMARPIRALTEQRGFRTSSHNLSCFGGAGGQHATALAALLGMHYVVVHKYSSILSAYGMALADVAVDVQDPFVTDLATARMPAVEERFSALKERALGRLVAQGVDPNTVDYDCFLALQYQGSDTTLMVLRPTDDDFTRAFIEEHKREFAFTLDAPVTVGAVRVRATAKGLSEAESWSPYMEELRQFEDSSEPDPEPQAFGTNSVYFEEVGDFSDVPLFHLHDLVPGTKILGPAIILDDTQTIVLHPQNVARILRNHVFIDVGLGPRKAIDIASVDPIQLSIFSHRFMGIAEQMCRALQKTSVSVAIKERLDFSCAIFDANGELVANAPNVPAHLGSMQYAVMYQAVRRRGQLHPGDLLVSNTPEAGGGHLPDITVIQPIFDAEGEHIVFWVAARGHHTDIGGLGGNSHHPDQTERWQEGVAFDSMFIVRDGEFNEQGVVEHFAKAGTYPGCKATKRLDHNISDLKAQCSACAVGSTQLKALFDEYGNEVVHFYMKAIRDNAEACTRDVLRAYAGREYSATDYFDDGTVVKLKINIDAEDGSGVFDFTGTGPEVLANFNAPPAITRSAILYCLKTMSGTDIPMNAGVLAPLKIIIPEGSVLSASEDAAVSQGNGEVAQRVADIIFTAFNVMSGSHGSMNGTHLMYGKYTWAETTCGGASAGPTWAGQNAVHTNMTNTRIGDLELLETRFPAMLREFSIRRGTGGAGAFKGGDGIRRVYEALVDMEASHDGQRRVIAPHGTMGGEDGERGASYLLKQTSKGGFRTVKLKPAAQVSMRPGEQLIVHTAGAGGWGRPEDNRVHGLSDERHVVMTKGGARPPPFTKANGSVSQYAQAQAECD